MSEETKSAPATEPKKVRMTILGIIGELEAGLTRKQIAEKHGVTKAAIDVIFKDPKLKGKKTHKNSAADIELVDDDVDNKVPVLSTEHWDKLAEMRKGQKIGGKKEAKKEAEQVATTEASTVGKW